MCMKRAEFPVWFIPRLSQFYLPRNVKKRILHQEFFFSIANSHVTRIPAQVVNRTDLYNDKSKEEDEDGMTK